MGVLKSPVFRFVEDYCKSNSLCCSFDGFNSFMKDMMKHQKIEFYAIDEDGAKEVCRLVDCLNRIKLDFVAIKECI